MPRRVRFNALLGGTFRRRRADLAEAAVSCGVGRSKAAAPEATVVAWDSLPLCPKQGAVSIAGRTARASFILESGTSKLPAKRSRR